MAVFHQRNPITWTFSDVGVDTVHVVDDMLAAIHREGYELVSPEHYMVGTVEELDVLPDRSVVCDRDGRVWQKLLDKDQGLPDEPIVGTGYVWFAPGGVDGYRSNVVVLPAQFLGVT